MVKIENSQKYYGEISADSRSPFEDVLCNFDILFLAKPPLIQLVFFVFLNHVLWILYIVFRVKFSRNIFFKLKKLEC